MAKNWPGREGTTTRVRLLGFTIVVWLKKLIKTKREYNVITCYSHLYLIPNANALN